MLKTAPDSQRKSELGQYFTPPEIAEFMADLFAQRADSRCRLLDAGAGAGALSAAFLERWVCDELHFCSVEIDAFEIDWQLHPSLTQTFEKYRHYPTASAKIRSADFIFSAADWVSGNYFAEELPKYTHAILNPPYRKIRSNSEHREALRRAGIETVNLYAAFTALALALLDDRGQLVAILPRSFCNGPYYRNFRDFVLQRAAIRHMHLFKSRSEAFKDDNVLQENIIVLLERGGQQGPIRVSTSTDATFSDLSTHEHPFDQIVLADDPERFIHVPTSPNRSTVESSPSLRYALSDLGVDVSTGPVVDFRVKAHLCDMPRAGTIPLLYPGHCRNGSTTWPLPAAKKPNAINFNEDTKKWLYPNGFYCLVRRFSSKEEKRRIMASIVDPAVFADAPLLGFENHLNVFHENKRGLPEALARGLVVFLNTTAVDEYFRRFNGHTQVNATDLKLLKYPHRDVLIELGEWALQQEELKQPIIDEKVESLTHD